MTSTSIRARNLAAAISMALATAGLHAATITVESTDDSPESMYCNLRDALQAINDGSTTNVPACSGAVSGSAFGTSDTVEFAGDLAGTSITLSQGSLSLTAASVTINGSGQFIDAAGNGAVLAVGEGVTLGASLLFLTGGVSATSGGGVTIGSGAHVQFSDCSIYGNTAAVNGGALYLAPTAAVSLVRSKLFENSATTGGAIFAKDSAAVTATNTFITSNHASYNAGAIYSFGSTLTLDTTTITKNTAPQYSGGVVAMLDTISVSGSTISGNIGGTAGGMFLSSSDGTISKSSISGNTAVCGSVCGGAMILQNSTFTITGSTLSGNLAAGHADIVTGGVVSLFSTTNFVNSTISANAGVGDRQVCGAAWQFGGDGLTFINSTVGSNTAAAFYDSAAGGILLGDAHFSPPPPSTGKLTLRNTIVSSNTPPDSDIVLSPYNYTVAAAYSLLGSSQNIAEFNNPADHNIFSDSPKIAPLADNGGATKTRALQPDSPALRAGSRALAMFSGQLLNYDQRGSSYLRDIGGSVDIGAFQDQGDRPFANGFESEP